MRLTWTGLILIGVALGQQAPPAVVAGIPVNYDEAKVGEYKLPELGAKDRKTWETKRRPEIVRLFEENEYGRAPGRPSGMTFDVFDKGTPAFDGKALRKQITIHFGLGHSADLLLYTPAGAVKPVPVLLNVSFG